MIDDKTKEILQSIVDSIEQAADEEDQEILLEAIKSIPEDFWKNSECSITIMESFLSHIGFDFFVYPIEFIPESFWEDRGMVWSYAVTLSQFYCDINIDYNMSELIPMELLKDKEIAKLLLSVNYFETVDSIPQELWIDREIIFSAFDGLDRVIEQREHESSMLEPYDKEECLRALFTYIPKDLALDVDFLLVCVARYCEDEGADALLDWIDESLWSDKELVIEILKMDASAAFKRMSSELLCDKEIMAVMEEEYDLCELGYDLLDEGNTDAGLACLRYAAEAGDEDAQALLADIYRDGDIVARNLEEALKWSQLSAQSGNPNGMWGIAQMYRDGIGVEKSFEEYLKYCKLAAESGNRDAAYELGYMYYRGEEVERDYNQAYYWFDKDGFRNLPYYISADMYFHVDRDYKNAFRLYNASLELDFYEYAAYKIGEMYYHGLGVEQSYEKALEYLKYFSDENVAEEDFEEYAAEEAPATVNYILSEMYKNGLGVEKNQELSEKLFNAAEKSEWR